MTISTSLTGNISDHLIRYAICRTVAEKNRYKYGINPTPSHDYYGGREQMWFFKDINYGELNNTPYGELPPGTDNVWTEKREIYPDHAYHPFQPDIFDVGPNTKLEIYCGQDAHYLDKEKVKKWLEIKDDVAKDCQKTLKNNNIELDENLCIISCRGGEYRGVPGLFLTKKYWYDAINFMLKRNPKMKFIAFTEDPEFYKMWFDFPVVHFSPHCDYYAIHTCKNIIIANSGFNIFPLWTSDTNPYILAPKYWAIHNFGNTWANSDMQSWGFNFMDREGNVDES
jgi:hypothetical protein